MDDVPYVGTLPSSTSRLTVAKQMIAIFKKHQIDDVQAMIVGYKAVTTDGANIMNEWVASGYQFANHSYSHKNLVSLTSASYINDIFKNEAILKKYAGSTNYHFYRYPYLSEGESLTKRNAVRKWLFANGYKIDHVTVGWQDTSWNDPYIRCRKTGDDESLTWLKNEYIQQAGYALTIAHELSTVIFGRDIANILLIHTTPFTAAMLDQLLTSYEQAGVRFISLAEALNDPAYLTDPAQVSASSAGTFYSQMMKAKKLKNPQVVVDLKATYPTSKLTTLCS